MNFDALKFRQISEEAETRISGSDVHKGRVHGWNLFPFGIHHFLRLQNTSTADWHGEEEKSKRSWSKGSSDIKEIKGAMAREEEARGGFEKLHDSLSVLRRWGGREGGRDKTRDWGWRGKEALSISSPTSYERFEPSLHRDHISRTNIYIYIYRIRKVNKSFAKHYRRYRTNTYYGNCIFIDNLGNVETKMCCSQ